MLSNKRIKTIDIFCDIIDNYGDIGFVYRLARGLYKKQDSLKINVFLNNISSFGAINKRIDAAKKIQSVEGINYYNLDKLSRADFRQIIPGQIAIEAFACELPKEYLINYKNNLRIIINLEYFTCETWTKEYHMQSSYTHLEGVKKFFYFPGIHHWSGGLIYTENRFENQSEFISLINRYGKVQVEVTEPKVVFGSIFSYEHNFNNFLDTLNDYGIESEKKIYLMVFGEKSNITSLQNTDNIKIIPMDYLNQEDYDKVLSMCDFNLVRGEESFARALLSGKPFLWHAYCQDMGTHMEKVEGFMKFIASLDTQTNIHMYENTMRNYNCRNENSYEPSQEDFKGFIYKLDMLSPIFEKVKNSIIANGNLIDKLIKFIEKEL